MAGAREQFVVGRYDCIRTGTGLVVSAKEREHLERVESPVLWTGLGQKLSGGCQLPRDGEEFRAFHDICLLEGAVTGRAESLAPCRDEQ
ncbi:hypothetical protein ADM96_02225 [Burkholderia sp. ST111]|nr:hypothetical protein ADM96_02225 [Burkholderia sp. ST111]